MSVDVAVVRVFTDETGRFGNPAGIIDGTAHAPAERWVMIGGHVVAGQPLTPWTRQTGGRPCTP